MYGVCNIDITRFSAIADIPFKQAFSFEKKNLEFLFVNVLPEGKLC